MNGLICFSEGKAKKSYKYGAGTEGPRIESREAVWPTSVGTDPTECRNNNGRTPRENA